MLPDYLHDIEDYKNVGSSCRRLHSVMHDATPRQILHLAIDASRIFFRPSPHFLVAATARELGQWARQSVANEEEFVSAMQNGLDGMIDLASKHCGLSMNRIRELYEMRFSTIKPVTDIMDKCIGNQWYATEDFWDGGVSDAYTISADPAASVFHLAIYGEVFGPDFDIYLGQDRGVRLLRVETRLEFVKYCIPDYATIGCQAGARRNNLSFDGPIDPRRKTNHTGPYAQVQGLPDHGKDNNLALTWILKSSRWRPHWQGVRHAAGPDFGGLDDDWYHVSGDWRQRLWEACIVSQGLDGYEMMLADTRDQWTTRVRHWRTRIENMPEEPHEIHVGSTHTHEYPYLAGDLRVLATGFVSGT